MKSTSLVFAGSFLSTALAAAAPKCNADNCARAVTGSALGGAVQTAHLSGCQSYFQATVTTNLADGSGSIDYPTAIPSYASACSGSARYSSACSCAGATSTTVTVTVSGTETPSPASQAVTSSSSPACTSINEVLDGPDQPVTYNQYFAGTGKTENKNNPGNRYQDPITATYTGSKCVAASSAAAFAAYANYDSFDIHQTKAKNEWEAVL